MNSRYEDYQRLSKQIKEHNPGLWKLCFPRHYLPPTGYASPKIAACSFASQLIMSNHEKQENYNKTKTDCTLLAWKMCEIGVPTYFVGDDFVTALAMSDVPPEMKLSELEWPHEAMLFMLPESFQNRFFKRAVPFVAVSRQPHGLQTPPMCVLRNLPNPRKIGIESKWGTGPYYIYMACIFFAGKAIDYAGSFPVSSTMGEVLSDKGFRDFTDHNASGYVPDEVVPSPEEDVELLNKIFAVTCWLMMAMNAEPHWIEPATVTCHRPPKAGEAKDYRDLWSPNFLGRRYTLPREPLGGTHASPRLHRPKGHWKHVAYGPKLSLNKLQWIKPYWRGKDPNAKEKETTQIETSNA